MSKTRLVMYSISDICILAGTGLWWGWEAFILAWGILLRLNLKDDE